MPTILTIFIVSLLVWLFVLGAILAKRACNWITYRLGDYFDSPTYTREDGMGTTPLKYQRKAIRKTEYLFNSGAQGVLIAMDMGLGKTPTSLWWADWHLGQGPILVICPAGLKYQWQSEAVKHINRSSEILSSQKPYEIEVKDNSIVIVNYDILSYWSPYLLTLSFQLVIVDEAHYIGNMTSKRSKCTRELAKKAAFKLFLSGTPFMSKTIQLFNILNLCRPDLFPSRFTFGLRYCQGEKKRGAWEFDGADRLPELNRKMVQSCMVRFLKSDVLQDLPPQRRHIIALDFDDRDQYMKAEKDFKTWANSNWAKMNGGTAYAQKLQVEGLARYGILKRLIGRLKIRAVREWIENFLIESNEKIIVFGIHKAVLKPLAEHFGDQCGLIDGETPPLKRKEIIEQFNHTQELPLLLANIKAGGVGWSASDCPNTAAIELGDNPADHTQAEARTHGYNRGKVGHISTAYYLMAAGTIEERIAKRIQDKQETFSSIIDGRKIVEQQWDLFTIIQEELRG